MFSGSYGSDDVIFLLKPVRLEPTDVLEKERLIQSGRKHYSEMISRETLPTAAYLAVFHQALAREKTRFARDVLLLARHLDEIRAGPITLVSLARAGTPIGVLLVRALRQICGRQAVHYSISIIRDRGIDEKALGHIVDRHDPASVVFVDGWTGKGVIARELRRAVSRFAAEHTNPKRKRGTPVDPSLYAVADLCGAAGWAAASVDYLIPSCVLGCTVSGLISRSILNDQVIGPEDFHGCVFHEEFTAADLSSWFVAQVFTEMERLSSARVQASNTVNREQQTRLRAASEIFLRDMQDRFGVRHVNHIKPGLGEATRVLLRRVPQLLLVKDASQPDVAHLLVLAQEKQVPVVVDPVLPYAAAALIKELEG